MPARPVPPDPRTDLQLLAALRAGEPAAFDALYFRHRDWVFRLAWRFTSDENEALDVLQEVFTYLARKISAPDFHLTAALTTFLYPAVKHSALALKRKRRRMGAGTSATAEIEAMEIPAKIPAADPGTLRAQLAEVLQNLSDPHREVILMRFVDDMALEEIAAALAIPLGTVKSRLHHAVAALREDSRLRRYFDKE